MRLKGEHQGFPPGPTIVLYVLGATVLLLDWGEVSLGLAPGVATYAAGYLLLGGAAAHAFTRGMEAGTGALRLLTLAPLAPIISATAGLLGDRILESLGIVSGHAPIYPAAYIFLTAAVAIACVIWVAESRPPAAPSDLEEPPGPHVSRLTIAVIEGTLAASVVALALWFARSGVIPMLQPGRAEEERFLITRSGEYSLYSRFIYLGSVALALRLALFLARAEPRHLHGLGRMLALSTPLFVGLVLFGSKYLYVYPIGVAVLAYDRFQAPVRFWRPGVLVAAAAFVIAMVLITNVRGLGRAIGNSILGDVFIVMPEYRDMAATVAIGDRLGMRVDTYGQLIQAGIPSEFAQLLGAPRKDLADRAYVYKQLLGYTFAGGSVRIGIMGELYMNSRLPGVAVGIAFLLSLIAALDRAARSPGTPVFARVIALALGLQVIWMFQAELTTILPVTYLFAYFLFLLLVINKLQPSRETLRERTSRQ